MKTQTVEVRLNDNNKTKWTFRQVSRWEWKDGILTVVAEGETFTFPERMVQMTQAVYNVG